MSIVSTVSPAVRSGDLADLPDWRQSMREAIRTLADLADVVTLPPDVSPAQPSDFPLFASREFLSRINSDDASDPLLRQILPIQAEYDPQAQLGAIADPLGEARFGEQRGVLRKYRSRVLIVATGTCPVHCRYCFRRHFPYGDNIADVSAVVQTVQELCETDGQIDEVVLSGGDPLTLADVKLASLVEGLAAIAGLRRLRVHSRMPIAVPQRVTLQLTTLLRSTRLMPWVVIHANHPHEIDEYVSAAIARLVDAGIPVLNQSVLLRGVNDRSQVLIELSRRLLDSRALPYYLHELDHVTGAAHFRVPTAEAVLLIKQMREALPGYAVPRLVRETPEEQAKTVIA